MKEHKVLIELPGLLVVGRVAPTGEIRLAFVDERQDRIFEWLVTPVVWARWAQLTQLVEQLNGELLREVPREKPVLFAVGDPFPQTCGLRRGTS